MAKDKVTPCQIVMGKINDKILTLEDLGLINIYPRNFNQKNFPRVFDEDYKKEEEEEC